MSTEFGLITFADMQPLNGEAAGKAGRQRLADLMEEIKLADELGLDVFGVGEHHRPDYAVSSPATVLAAAAMITKQIRLSSAVTVLSSDEPVRVHQQFATVDLLSNGRAEIMAGRGSFIESFPLFGYDLDDYNELFSEKLDLLLKINSGEPVTWSGKHRPPLKNMRVYPQPLAGKMPVWIAAGGTPSSAVRAATLGLPLMLAIIGGRPAHFQSFINLYRETAAQKAPDGADIRVGVNNHMFVGESSSSAANDFYPHYAAMMDRVGRDRGWQPMSKAQFEMMRAPEGSLLVGSVQEVVEKILYQHALFKFDRFLAQSSLGTLPHLEVMRSIELFGSKVVPEVKKALKA